MVLTGRCAHNAHAGVQAAGGRCRDGSAYQAAPPDTAHGAHETRIPRPPSPQEALPAVGTARISHTQNV